MIYKACKVRPAFAARSTVDNMKLSESTFFLSAMGQLRPSMQSTMSEHRRQTSLLPANHLRYIFSSAGTSGSLPGTLEPSSRACPAPDTQTLEKQAQQAPGLQDMSERRCWQRVAHHCQ